MKISGVIVEYNPLHNGHMLHLVETKKITKCDYVIAVMSGNFVQRGEPAFVNKWARTEMALNAGVDLVLELPLLYSISSAEGFAYGAVASLNLLGIIDFICFGSELGSIDSLYTIAKLLVNEPDDYKIFLKEGLDSGFSFPISRQRALEKYFSLNRSSNLDYEEIQDIISNSNNILGIEYIKALINLGSTMKPYTIARVKNRYRDVNLTGSISSATAIRSNFTDKESIKEAIPQFTLDSLETEIKEGRGPLVLKNFESLIFYKIRQSSHQFIRNLIDVGEGFEYKIKEAAENTTSVEELISYLKSKRYTATRIQRILIYILLNIDKDVIKKIKEPPTYIRVLGFNDNGRKLLKEIKQSCPVPVITNPSKRDLEFLKFDIEATDTYVLGYQNPKHKISRQDLKKPPVQKSTP